MADSGPAPAVLATELSHQDVELLSLLAGGLPLDAVARRVGDRKSVV